MQKKHLITTKKAALLLIGLTAIFTILKDEISSPLLYQTLRGNTDYGATYTSTNIYIPPSLDADRKRALSLDLGDGNCKWAPPVYEVPEEVDFHKTFIAGFPSGDKRIAYLQMEALAGYPAKDEWDFAYLGMTNHPFIKGNYPHHEGIWGWGNAADQVIMMVPNIRRSMVEYHDILWDLGYATTWEDANLMRDNLYGDAPAIDDYYEWRDSRVLDEARWYGWYIDYWMEGGLLRDIFTHKLTTKEHWDNLLKKPYYTRAELDINNYVPEGTIVTPTYDPHCANLDISGGCAPVAIISADKLQHPTEGKAETSAIAAALNNDSRTGQHVIAQRAWDCIWSELIESKKGPKIITDRPGYHEIEMYNFSSEMLEVMIEELNRLITKYSGSEWNTKPTAIRLVEILTEHLGLIETELQQLNAGIRRLRRVDFLGPEERSKRKLSKPQEKTDEESPAVVPEKKDNSRYFIALEQKRFENKHHRAMKGKPAKTSMSDVDFIGALSNALNQIRSLEAGGGMDRITATALVERIRKVAKDARVVLMKDK